MKLNRKYHVKWTYDKINGGQLFVDDELKGKVNYKVDLKVDASSNVILKGNIYKGGGRYHTEFDGAVENVKIKTNGKQYDNVTNGYQIPSQPEEDTEMKAQDTESNDKDKYISDLFHKLGIPSKYVDIFNKEEITAKSLLLLSANDLKVELGMKLGPRKILMGYIDSNKMNRWKS